MSLDVTMKEPLPRVVGIKLDHHLIAVWNRNRVFERRVLQIQRGCLRLRIRTASYPTFSNIKKCELFAHRRLLFLTNLLLQAFI